MTTTRGGRNRWLVAFGGVALVVATSSCSALIASRGVSSVREIYTPETRAEVQAAFGAVDETYTCPDGRTAERRSIRQRVPWVCQRPDDPPACQELWSTYFWTLGLADVFVIPVIAYRSEQAKLHYVFVYDADERVAYRYSAGATQSEQFAEAVRSLHDSLLGRLNEGGCPFWGPCLSAFEAEVRQRAACVGYTLTPVEKEMLRLLQALAADVDAGRLAPDDTVAELRWCLGSERWSSFSWVSWSCLRP